MGRADLVDHATLVVCELVANAVMHTRTELDLSGEPAGADVRVAVSDGSPVLPRWTPASATASMRLRLRRDDAVAAREWLAALDEAEDPTNHGTLLLPPFPQSMVVFRRDYIAAVIAELEPLVVPSRCSGRSGTRARRAGEQESVPGCGTGARDRAGRARPARGGGA
ncbi:hypothetical protein [Kineococcus xinjiangensis]|nr:hypothetical protein [Kineococcus xinjiangensis]